MQRRRSAIILVGAVLLVSCGLMRDKENVRQGLLISGQDRRAFLDLWGPPERTSSITGDDNVRADWGGGGGFFFKGKEVYDVWEYPQKGVTLVFCRGRLTTWKTGKTVAQLRE